MSYINDERNAYSDASYYSVGLRNYLIKVYNFMAVALGLTGVVALLVASSPELLTFVHNSPFKWVVIFSPLALVFVLSYKLQTLSMQAVFAIFFSFSVLIGMSLSSIFMIYTSESIARVFFISSIMFGITAWYGNVTKKDLSKYSTFLLMGLIGIIVASLVNLIFHSSALQFATSIVGVLVFTGMTAHDAQDIKDWYYRINDGSGSSSASLNKVAVMGATRLYFNYINIFLSLLNLFGNAKDR